MSQMKWYILDPAEAERSPYDLTEDQRDLLAKDLDKQMPPLANEDGKVTPRQLVDKVLDLLEVWHG